MAFRHPFKLSITTSLAPGLNALAHPGGKFPGRKTVWASGFYTFSTADASTNGIPSNDHP